MYLLSFIHQLTSLYVFFFFNDTATTEIYTLSLHDALPICTINPVRAIADRAHAAGALVLVDAAQDRKSTRLNSSHGYISYAVFCLKKKKNKLTTHTTVDFNHSQSK